MPVKTLYDYYGTQPMAPTFANLRDEASLASYESMRDVVLSKRLGIPRAFFRGAEVLEYGPDTGENAVVFARWGSRMTLVEPAVKSHPQIRAYFERFAPQGSLTAVHGEDVLAYAPSQRFDMVVAEGFIYTVQPATAWLARFASALRPGGLALISYYERWGFLFELSLRVPFAALTRRGDKRPDAAEHLYRPKWDRVPHTRAFESWAMDVLENPFVRSQYALGAEQLLRDAEANGLELHASWPSYGDGLHSAWAKSPWNASAESARSSAHIVRSVLSFVLGRKAYLADDEQARRIAALVDRAVADTDALVDADDAARSLRLAATLRELAAQARAARVLVEDRAGFEAAVRAFDSWAAVHEALGEGRTDAAVERLRGDDALLDTWGLPAHLLVLRRASGSES